MSSAFSNLTYLALALPFLAAILAPFCHRALGYNAAWLLAIAPALMFIHFLAYLPAIADGGTMVHSVPWIPSLGVGFGVLIDGLSLTFALLISGIGLFIVLFSGGYLKGHPMLGRFFSFIFLFMGSMLGLVLSDSLLMLFVFWELTSITSFLLIGFDHGRGPSRRSAVQALVVTGGGGLALLAGLLIIQAATGATSLSEVLALGDGLRDSPLYLPIFLLVLGGCFTKSAQFPFHFWLPNAMEAPTPVSAYLHSATMVKAGVYLLMRLQPALGGTTLWETVLPIFGAVTLLAGVILGLRQTDLKLILAYTTVASLGLLVLLTGFGTEYALSGAVLYLVAHSLFKGCLFMVVGGVDHEAGSRDLRDLSGLGRAMPLTFAIALIAALSMGGLPPMLGFLAKEELYHGLEYAEGWKLAILGAAILGNAMMLALGFIVGLRPFLGSTLKAPKKAHEGPVLLWIGAATLSALGLLAGLFSETLHALISSPMASAVAGEPVTVEIGPIPHLNVAFYLSLATIVLGIVLYLVQDPLRSGFDRALTAFGWGPDRGFDQAMNGLVRFCFRFTNFFQTGQLDGYMTMTFTILAAGLLIPMAVFEEWPSVPELPILPFYEWTILAIIIIGLFAVVSAANRLTAIVSLGIQGFGVAVLFMLLGAPDLSFTQFMVETLSVVILALVMTRIPLSKADHRPNGEKLVDMGVAGACGLGFALLLLRVTEMPFDASVSEFYESTSRVVAHGRNIVNVIIVDFRGLDTLGEIAVVMIAGLAILALIRVQRAADGQTISEKGPEEAIGRRENA